MGQLHHIRVWLMLLLVAVCYGSAYSQNCSVNAGVASNVCAGDVIELEGALSGLYDGSTLVWSVVSEPAGGGVTIAQPNSLNSLTNNLTVVGTYTFQLLITCQDGFPASQNVSHTVNAVPSLPTVSAIGPVCPINGGTVALTGTTPPVGSTGEWSISSGITGYFDDFTDPTTNYNVTWPQEYCSDNFVRTYYRWTITNAIGCVTSQVTSTNFELSFGGPDITIYESPVCGDCTYLEGSCPGDGAGAWTVVTKPAGAADPSFTSTTAKITNICDLEPGNYQVAWTITGGCDAGADTVAFNVAAAMGVTISDAGNDLAFCEFPSTASLSGNVPSADEAGTWVQVGGSDLSVDDSSQYNTEVSGFISGEAYEFIWVITNDSGCISYDNILLTERAVLEDGPTYPSYYCYSGTSRPSPFFSFEVQGSESNLYDTLRITLDITETDFIDNPYATATPYVYFSPGYTYHYGTLDTLDGYSYTWTFPNINSIASIEDQLYYASVGAVLTETGYLDTRMTIENECYTTVATQDMFVNLLYNNTGANAGTDQILACTIDTAQLVGNNLSSGGFYRGRWSIVSRPSGSTAPTFNPNRKSQNTTVSGLSNGLYTFRLQMSSGYSSTSGAACASEYSDVNVYVATTPPAKPSLGPDVTICHSKSYDLSVSSSSSSSTLGWFQIAGPNTLNFSPSSTARNVSIDSLHASATYTLVWIDTNGCGTNSDTLNITTTAVSGPSQAQISTSDLCNNYSSIVALAAVPPTSGTGTWSQLSGPGTISFSPKADTTHVNASTLLYYNLYRFVYSVSVSGCPNVSTDTITVRRGPWVRPSFDSIVSYCNLDSFPTTFLYEPTNTYMKGMDVSWDFPEIPSAAAMPTFSHQDSVSTSVTYYDPGQYVLNFKMDRFGCGCDSVGYILNLSEKGSLAEAGPDTTLCGSNSLNLAATQPTTGSGQWNVDAILSGAPQNSFTDDTLYNTAFSISGNGSVQLAWTTYGSSQLCGPYATDYVTITHFEPAYAGEDQSLCGATSTLVSAEAVSPATGLWTRTSGPSAVTLSDASSPVTNVGSLVQGTYVLRWTVTAPGGSPAACSTFDEVQIVVDTIPPLNAGSDVSAFCYGAGEEISLSANTLPTGYTGLWTIETNPGVPGVFTPSATQVSTDFEYASDSGYYVFKWEITNGTCSRSDHVNVNSNISCLTLLPVQLLSFEVDYHAKNTQALLNWLAEDLNLFSHFDVERSTDGVSWEFLGAVEFSSGDNGLYSYDFLDKSPPDGLNYYRLKLVDISGEFEYSPVRVLFFNFIAGAVFPNPTSDGYVKTSGFSQQDLVSASVLNASGKLSQVNWVSENQLLLPDSPGIYLLDFRHVSGARFTYKLFVE